MIDYLSVSLVCLSNWRLTDWLTDWQTSAALVTDWWLPNWLNDCGQITPRLYDWRSLIERLTERLYVSVWLMNFWLITGTDCPLTAECLTDDSWFTVYFLTDWPTYFLDDWLTGWLIDWLTEWTTDRPTGQLANRLTDLLTDRLTNWLTNSNSKSLLCLTL